MFRTQFHKINGIAFNSFNQLGICKHVSKYRSYNCFHRCDWSSEMDYARETDRAAIVRRSVLRDSQCLLTISIFT